MEKHIASKENTFDRSTGSLRAGELAGIDGGRARAILTTNNCPKTTVAQIYISPESFGAGKLLSIRRHRAREIVTTGRTGGRKKGRPG